MGRLAWVTPLVALLVGCGPRTPAVSPASSQSTPEELAQRYLDGHSRSCRTNADCGTNLCDQSLSLWASEDVGLCVSLFRATERWQRRVVAQSVADKMKDNPELTAAVWSGVRQRYYGQHDLDAVEGMMLLARCAATDEARRFLSEVLEKGTAPERLHAAISLGKTGDAAGMDLIAEASASSQPVMRVHAAWAAGRICTSESLGVVDVLARDPHPMVRQAGLLSLAQCRSQEAESLRQRLRKELLSDPEDAEPGTAWLLGL